MYFQSHFPELEAQDSMLRTFSQHKCERGTLTTVTDPFDAHPFEGAKRETCLFPPLSSATLGLVVQNEYGKPATAVEKRYGPLLPNV